MNFFRIFRKNSSGKTEKKTTLKKPAGSKGPFKLLILCAKCPAKQLKAYITLTLYYLYQIKTINVTI
jgi:hypothetical protein